MSVEEAIYDKLMDAGGVTALVKREIYRGFRSQGQSLPCLTFLRISTVPSNGAAGGSGTEQVLVQIDCWAKLGSEARNIAEAVKTTLDGWSRTSSPTIGAALLQDERDIMEPPDLGGQIAEFRVAQTWSIWLKN